MWKILKKKLNEIKKKFSDLTKFWFELVFDVTDYELELKNSK